MDHYGMTTPTRVGNVGVDGGVTVSVAFFCCFGFLNWKDFLTPPLPLPVLGGGLCVTSLRPIALSLLADGVEL